MSKKTPEFNFFKTPYPKTRINEKKIRLKSVIHADNKKTTITHKKTYR
jgi:hypothetical protein